MPQAKKQAQAQTQEQQKQQFYEALLVERLAERKLFNTAERRDIYNVMLDAVKPIDAQSIHEQVLATGKHISLTTVYSTLELLCRLGLVVRLAPRNEILYVATVHTENRMLVICNECGKISYHNRYKIYDHLRRIIIPHHKSIKPLLLGYGYCAECKRRINQTNKTTKQQVITNNGKR